MECLKAAPDVILERLARTETPVNPDSRLVHPRHPVGTTPVVTEQDCFNNFKKFIGREKTGLTVFYESDGAIRKLAPAAKTMVDKLFAIGYIKQTALELSILVLYDMVVLIGLAPARRPRFFPPTGFTYRSLVCDADDSSSMQFEQEGRRIKTLIRAMDEITAIYDLANPTGIKAIRFINAKKGLTDVTNDDWKTAFHERIYRGVSRVGTALHQKILKQFVWRNPMTKPLLVMIITDGDVRSFTSPYLSTETNSPSV